MPLTLADIIRVLGGLQLCVLIASALVPLHLKWKTSLDVLPRLHRQLYWVYGGYVVLAITALGLISLINPTELAAGSLLARSVCAYIAVFWGVRLSLQLVLDAKQHLSTWWLSLGYHLLTVLFVTFTTVFTWAAIHP